MRCTFSSEYGVVVVHARNAACLVQEILIEEVFVEIMEAILPMMVAGVHG